MLKSALKTALKQGPIRFYMLLLTIVLSKTKEAAMYYHF